MSLIEDAKRARAAGMTYGQYMVKKGFKPYEATPEKRRVCERCGAPLIGCRLRFCSDECRVEMNMFNKKGDKYV